MSFVLTQMTEGYAREIAGWRYDGAYAIYNAGANDVDEIVNTFLNTIFSYYAVLDDQDTLFGFCCYGADAQVPVGDYDYSIPALDIGFGMHPEQVGRGMGSAFLQAILEHASGECGDLPYRATVAEFNVRSRRIFERASFQPVYSFEVPDRDDLAFVVMMKQPDTVHILEEG